MKQARRFGKLRARCAVLLCGLLVLLQTGPAAAEEYYDGSDYSGEYDEGYTDDGYYEEPYYDDNNAWDDSYDDAVEEPEYIPEEYYEPIQTNDLPGWPQGPAVQAGSAIVMDLDTNAVLYGKNVEREYYPASITKIMTTLVALENGNLDDVIACSDQVYNIEADSSNLGIQPGEKLTLRQALYGLMLESANDLGMAIAVHLSGSVEAFADLMNEKAQALGCTHTHFVNPHGLHSDAHYTCAQDMARIAQAAYENPTFREIVSTKESSIPPTNLTEETRYFANHHRILQTDSDYYQTWATGGKTGYTSMALNTLVTFGERDGLRLVCVLLHENGAYRAYEETIALMEYAFVNFRHRSINNEVDAPTFYELIGMNYPNPNGLIFQSEEMQQKIVTVERPALVTLPDTVGDAQLTSAGGQAAGTIRYLYQGQEVGSGAVKLTPVPQGITLAFEQERDMDALLEAAKGAQTRNEIEETAIRAWEQVSSLGVSIKEGASDYVAENRMTVVLTGLFLLLILLILILILILRLTRESRLRRKREQAEKIRRRREEEIEKKSAVEIEEELREAMRAEQQRREKERQRRAQQLEEERKLREAEEVLEEIGRMQQDSEDETP